MGADMITNDVFSLASAQAAWLLARENAVAQNVANANTPGYRAADVKPFEASLQSASLDLAATSPQHIGLGGSQVQAVSDDGAADDGETVLSGNNVSQEGEMMKAGQIGRGYALNTAIVKAFNGMILLAAKG
jgi:flagellar basal-body rod protein FlgB